VTKFNATGTALVYSTFLGGTSADEIDGISVDSAGEVTVEGSTLSTDFPTTPGAFDTTYNGNWDAFAARLNASGTGLVFSTYLGGSGNDLCWAGATDASGAVYVVGEADSSPDYPTTPGAYDPTFNGGNITISGYDSDAFVTKLNSSGTALEYSTFLGGSLDDDVANGVAVDAAGEASVVGVTHSANFPTTSGAYDTTFAGGAPGGDQDAFVTKLNASGSGLVYSTFLGDAVATSASDTVGVNIPSSGTWFLRYSNAPGPADLAFSYGAAGAGLLPIVGDWDGNGSDTLGVYDPASSTFFLKNTNAPGLADIVFGFGAPGQGYVPLAGDWDGDGIDTVGLYNPATRAFYLKNTNAPGAADIVFTYGAAGQGYLALTGDWNGDGIDTIGLYNPTTASFFLKNTNEPGPADLVFGYGPTGATPVAGDWNGDGTDSIGVYMPATGAWFLRDTNTAGPADHVFSYGPAGATPVVGDWNGS
jgi:hypothetical protein